MAENYDMLIETIILQNKISTQSKNIKILSTYKGKQANSVNVIIEVDEKMYQEINNKNVLYIGWRKCRYFDHVNVIQCFKCWKYGHMTRECKAENLVCVKCSENHHQKDCKNEIEICTNCKHAKEVLNLQSVDYHHSAVDRRCEAYKRVFEKLQMRYNYPEVFSNNHNQ